MKLDKSQRKFCESDARYLRLLAPAGCGKTNALLYRCLHLHKKKQDDRFLLVTFTKAAELEAVSRLANERDFAGVRDAVTVSTLNAYGYRRLRNEIQHPRLLSSRADRHFAMRNQLRPVWQKDNRLSSAITGRGSHGNRLMLAVDALKALGFDHTADTSFEKFSSKLDTLSQQGLLPQMEIQISSLRHCRVFDEDLNLQRLSDQKEFYRSFFKFWCEAIARLHEESTFTFEDQKYWCWLDLRSPGPDGKKKRPVTGTARFAHLLVDEFQDINPLDLAFIKTIADRHRASITIVGDDDQAIFEWRGATPEYILNPDNYFGTEFQTITLETNYRSARNIVDHSQKLIRNNKRRVPKDISAVPGAGRAQIQIMCTGSIGERLQIVSEIAHDIRVPGKVAVIGRTRSQLVPYEVYYASDGGPVKTATDLDVFASDAFDHLMKLIEIWDRREDEQRPKNVVDDAMEVLNRVKRAPFNKKDNANVRSYLRGLRASTTREAVEEMFSYDGEPLSGRTHKELEEKAASFMDTGDVAAAIRAIGEGFAGLRFDFDKAEDDIWFAAPPLVQLADMAESEEMSADDLIDLLDAAKGRLRHYQFGDEGDEIDEERPLHLMTATRAKGKEFDTVILLDVNPGVWPHRRAESEYEKEAERRLFYVAFTRAQKRVVLLSAENKELSPFVHELDLPA